MEWPSAEELNEISQAARDENEPRIVDAVSRIQAAREGEHYSAEAEAVSELFDLLILDRVGL